MMRDTIGDFASAQLRSVDLEILNALDVTGVRRQTVEELVKTEIQIGGFTISLNSAPRELRWSGIQPAEVTAAAVW